MLKVVLAGAELSTPFAAFSPLRDVRREGGHGHTVSHPCHCRATSLDPSVCGCILPALQGRPTITEGKTKLSHFL